jgi:hypothetical protein
MQPRGFLPYDLTKSFRHADVVKKEKTSILSAWETRESLDHIDTASVVDLRDKALIALLV